MKILEAQSATLTNYEVYAHLTELRARDRQRTLDGQGNRPKNLVLIMKELMLYLDEAPSPLADKPLKYNENTVKTLLERLRKWDFTKAEFLMILNLRPQNLVALNVCVQEMDARIPEQDMQEIVGIIKEVLGTPDAKQGGDVEMTV